MKLRIFVAAILVLTSVAGARMQTPATTAPSPARTPLFAAIFKTGPQWDQAKPPNEQPFFKEHSANLARLRQAGTIVLGARYADIGLIVVSAAAEADARKLFESDPSVAHGTFQLDVHPFSVFYAGTVGR